MTDFLSVGIAIFIVGAAFLPLIGAQRKSLTLTEELVNEAIHIKAKSEDEDEKDRVDFMVKCSRSWLFSMLFLTFGPVFAFKSGLKLDKKDVDKKDDNFTELWLKTQFYSNPITMFLTILVCFVALFLGKLVVFSVLSFYAITANDDDKLNVNMSAKPSYDIVANFTSAIAFYKQIRIGH
ncbi:conserved membrane hypothetical protein [Vibrio crassostreae]|uniref:Uncharacterized protein n=1 Tax=Vibrio lentus TaxID=136468 RepID=A0A4V5RQ05_9VIBR|nr:hypothetical protein [Vibrio lentus]CAK2902000.1 conserved membrane hypothetical protein [Vibrio crassostreae]TKG04949.1 hypothetical protein FCV91_19235 [Vibrio lentus]TKG14129.1 hypothetical protein FCW05_23165 [Vibrio lentus]CAK2904203.1 conserved membrane hypothetical protein [Vibrio crassostreae]CAK2905116.1 conserved membrane hypothetical protein [Vibrio crassostreae]